MEKAAAEYILQTPPAKTSGNSFVNKMWGADAPFFIISSYVENTRGEIPLTARRTAALAIWYVKCIKAQHRKQNEHHGNLF